ncbi:MAG: transglutaminase domain-containing protein [Phycisphaerae bacterium]|nr:transglutaminase domain-containing protein [Phycisphaerae bacterium]
MLTALAVALVLVAPPEASPATTAQPSASAATSPPPKSVWTATELQAFVTRATERAGDNAPQIKRALKEVAPDQLDNMVWLLGTMPEHDLKSLTADFLLTNVRLAARARREAPWGKDIPDEIYRQYVLPYCSLNERRDDWRQDFFDRFHAEAWKFKDPIDAVKWINDHLPDMVKVHFSADKRKKPDQSPYESMEIGWASCTGLSILVVDACRAVGIPARVVGCPAWKTVQGNHTWVEVWWNRWYNVGDSGSDPRGVDWVEERCRTETDPDDWVHAVYAAVWRPTNVKFPLVWAFEIEYVPAVNVTRFYSAKVDHAYAVPGGGPADLEVRWAGELVARVKAGADGTAVLPLARGNVFEVTTIKPDGTRATATVKP